MFSFHTELKTPQNKTKFQMISKLDKLSGKLCMKLRMSLHDLLKLNT